MAAGAATISRKDEEAWFVPPRPQRASCRKPHWLDAAVELLRNSGAIQSGNTNMPKIKRLFVSNMNTAGSCDSATCCQTRRFAVIGKETFTG